MASSSRTISTLDAEADDSPICPACAQPCEGPVKSTPVTGHIAGCRYAEAEFSRVKTKRKAEFAAATPEEKRSRMERNDFEFGCPRCEYLDSYVYAATEEMIPFEDLQHNINCAYADRVLAKLKITKGVRKFPEVGRGMPPQSHHPAFYEPSYEEYFGILRLNEIDRHEESEFMQQLKLMQAKPKQMPEDVTQAKPEQMPEETQSEIDDLNPSSESEPESNPETEAGPSHRSRSPIRRSDRLRSLQRKTSPQPSPSLRKASPSPQPSPPIGKRIAKLTSTSKPSPPIDRLPFFGKRAAPVHNLRSTTFVSEFKLVETACIDKEADDHPMRPNDKQTHLFDGYKVLKRWPYERPDFDVRTIELNEDNFHPLQPVSLHHMEPASTQACHERMFGLNEAGIFQAKKDMFELMNLRHEQACHARSQSVPRGADYYYPENKAYKYRQEEDPLGTTFTKNGVTLRKRPIPGAEWPRGLPHPEWLNGEYPAPAGAAYANLRSRSYDHKGDWDEIRKGVPEVFDVNPMEFRRPEAKKKEPLVIDAEPKDDSVDAARGTIIRQIRRSQQMPKDPVEKHRLLDNIMPDAKREMERIAKKLNAEYIPKPKKEKKKPKPEPEPKVTLDEGQMPDILGFSKPAALQLYGVYVVEPIEDVFFPLEDIHSVGQIANKFYSGLNLSPEDKERFAYGEIKGGEFDKPETYRPIPSTQIPSNLFDEFKPDPKLKQDPAMLQRAAAKMWVHLIDWLEAINPATKKHNWETCQIPYWRAVDKSFINPKQDKFFFDERNRLNLFNWLSEESAGLKMPASQIAAGLLAIFCGHKEDSDVASTNAMMTDDGEKFWVCARRQDDPTRQEFERWAYAELFDECEAAHRHKVFFYDIRWLVAAGIHIFYHIQRGSELMFLSEETWHMGFSLNACIATSWNSAYLRWLFYFARKLIGNRREECTCHKYSKDLPSLNLVPSNLLALYEAWDQRHLFNDQQLSDLVNLLRKGNTFATPCIITDASSACWICPAQFRSVKARNDHVSNHHGGKYRKKKAEAGISDSDSE